MSKVVEVTMPSKKLLTPAELLQFEQDFPVGNQVDPINAEMLELFKKAEIGHGFLYNVPDREVLLKRKGRKTEIADGEEGPAFLTSTKSFFSTHKDLGQKKAQIRLSVDKKRIKVIRTA